METRRTQHEPWPQGRDIECPWCGYSLRGLARPVCPECGAEFRESDVTPAAPWPAALRGAQMMLVLAALHGAVMLVVVAPSLVSGSGLPGAARLDGAWAFLAVVVLPLVTIAALVMWWRRAPGLALLSRARQAALLWGALALLVTAVSAGQLSGFP